MIIYIIKAINMVLISFIIIFYNSDTVYSNNSYDLEQMCINEHNVDKCIELVNIYNIKNRNPQKALEILSIPFLKNNDYAKLNQAMILEISIADIDSINKAMDIYIDIYKNSKNKDYSEFAKKQLNNLPVYNFVIGIKKHIDDFFSENIDYSALENYFKSLRVDELPSQLKNIFLSWYPIYLKWCKLYTMKNGSWSAQLKLMGKNTFNAAIGDYSFLKDIKDLDNMNIIQNEADQYTTLLFEELGKINNIFINKLFK